MKPSRLQLTALVLVLAGLRTFAASTPDDARAWPQLLEKEWLLEAQLQAESQRAAKPATRDDAVGGCDGVTNGKWGFHTGQDANPWWQVDLGQPQPLAQVRLWNRSDTEGSAQRASKFLLLLSNDGKAWREVYHHNGQIFYGYRMPDRSPLVVKLTNAEARFVRVQLPGREFLHLDEVEVIGQRGGNLALNKPAEQSSVSQWSVAHRIAQQVDWRRATAKVLAQNRDSGAFAGLKSDLAALPPDTSAQPLYLRARAVRRQQLDQRLGSPAQAGLCPGRYASRAGKSRRAAVAAMELQGPAGPEAPRPGGAGFPRGLRPGRGRHQHRHRGRRRRGAGGDSRIESKAGTEGNGDNGVETAARKTRTTDKPQAHQRCGMKGRGLRMNAGGWQTRSVLECGSPLPLSAGGARPVAAQSARGLAQSKTWRSFVAAFAFLATAIAVQAQYSIDWFKIAGGGGTSTGGVYSVSGTIGQHDAGGPMTNGPYSLVGGFWVLPILVQTPGSPTLHITNAAPGFATIWWTPPTPGFTLQFTDSLSPTNWGNAPSGTTNPATVPATLPTRFYRLTHP